MASAPAQCYQESTKLLFLIALWCALPSGGATVKVTQEPPFASSFQGGSWEFKCSLSDSSNYHFFWYRQLPGKKELQHIGTLYYHEDKLQEISEHDPRDWLDGKWLENGKKMSLELQGLQPSDTGLYLCAARDPGGSTAEQAYFADTGTQLIVEDETCQRSQPTVHLLGPVCHKEHVTLVCVAQGFPYAWPIDVSWKRDAQEVTHLSVATDPVRTLDSPCKFGVSSRLSMTAAEWQERHVYSCRVRQGNIAEAEESMEREPSQQSASTVLEFQSSLHTGQVIFLLLVVKSFAYGTALGIYTACKKKTGL